MNLLSLVKTFSILVVESTCRRHKPFDLFDNHLMLALSPMSDLEVHLVKNLTSILLTTTMPCSDKSSLWKMLILLNYLMDGL